MRVMVVVELLSPDKQAERQDIAGCVASLEVAVTEVVPDAVHHACCPKGYPQYLNEIDQEARQPEEREVDQEQHRNTQEAVCTVDAPL